MNTNDSNTEIQVMPLDELKFENAAILKADVEGFEMDVLRGDREPIKNFLQQLLYVCTVQIITQSQFAISFPTISGHAYECF